MSRRKFILVYLALLLLLSVAVIGFGSWMIVPTTSTQISAQKQADTSPYFTSDKNISGVAHVFNGSSISPVPTTDGVDVFGSDYKRNDNSTSSGYTAIWKKGERYDNGGEISKLSNNAQEKIAGTHYYTIVDNLTGQIIAKDHEVVITPATFTASAANPSGPVFIGDANAYSTITLTANDGKNTAVSFKHTFAKNEFGDATNHASAVIGFAYTNNQLSVAANSDYKSKKVPSYSASNAAGLNTNNYIVPTNYSVAATFLPRASAIVSGSTSYYNDLEQALTANQAATATVIPLQSFSYTVGEVTTTYKNGAQYHHVISNDCTVGNNVTLLIRHDTTTTISYGSDDYSSTPFPDQITTKVPEGTDGVKSSFGDTTKRLNHVTISAGKTLTSNGKIYISGQVTGSQNGMHGASLTTGNHSQITLQTGAKIEASNDIYCYGFIAEETLNNGSSVNVTSGNVITVYTVIEHRGGSIFGGMAGGISGIKNPNLQTSAFNRFYFRSMTATLSVSGSATISGYADLYAADQHNTTIIKLVGYNDNYLISLDSGGKLSAKFRTDTQKNEIHLYGNAEINSMSLTIKLNSLVSIVAGTDRVSLSTEKVLFPISHYLDIYLHKFENGNNASVVTNNQNIKILPGGSITIDRGVSFNVNTLVVYPEEVSSSTEYSNLNVHTTAAPASSVYPYKVKTAGLLNVYGSLTVTNFGGEITAKSPDATVKITGTNTLKSKELATTADGTITDDCTYREVPLTANGNVYNSSTPTAGTTLAVNTQYTGHQSNSVLGWVYNKTINVTYESNGGTAVTTKTATVASNLGLTISGAYVPRITRSVIAPNDYTFDKWYLDAAFSQAASGQTVYADVTLHARWTPTNYTLKYQFDADGFEPAADLPQSSSFNIETLNIALPTPVDTSGNGYNFLGWYTDAAHNNKINTATINGDVLVALLNGSSEVILYGLWGKESYTFKYQVDQDYIRSDLENTEAIYSPAELENATWMSVNDYSTDKTKEYYFNQDNKWLYEHEGTWIEVSGMTPAQFVESYGGESKEFIFKPDLIKKYELTISGSSGATAGTAITINDKHYLIESQFAEVFAEYDLKAKAQDNEKSTNKYFVKWTANTPEGETLTAITAASFTDKKLVLLGNFGNKLKLTVNYNGYNSADGYSFQNYDGYLIPDSEGKITYTISDMSTAQNNYKDIGKITYFTGWTANGCTVSGTTVTATTDSTLTAKWATKSKIVVTHTQQSGDSGTTTDAKFKLLVTDGTSTYIDTQVYTNSGLTAYVVVGHQFMFEVTSQYNNSSNLPTGWTTAAAAGHNYKIDSYKKNCVTPDTLITLADGTQVRVDSLKGDELLLVWNLETGMLDVAPIMFIDSDPLENLEVINLWFSDGTVVGVISEHGFWDYDLNRYVYLDANAADYIGHSFAKKNGDTLERVTLVDVTVENQVTTAWSPVTVGHLCYFVNGMLSMPGGVGGLFNIFEVDVDTMTYDYEAMERDIATYGLYTYEELNAIAPLSRDMFEAAGGAYMKISIGKGNLTLDELIYMINRYASFFE